MQEKDIRSEELLRPFLAYLRQDAERLALRRGTFQPVPCPFCGANSPTPAFDKDGFTYQLCAVCASLYASPRPALDDLVDFAMNSEATRYWSTHLYPQTAQARREKIFRPRATLVADLARQGLLPSPGRLLDIGAGYGLFLQEMAAQKWQGGLLGLEPDPRLAHICREQGFSITEKWVEDIAEGELAADGATAFEVLEHVYDPHAFLSACARTVRPGGVLLFTTLTISGFDLQVLWEHSRSITPPQHLNFASTAGIQALIARCQLELVELSTPGQLDVDIVRNALTANPDLAVPRFVRTLALADEATRQDFQTFLQNHRLSSHLRCIVRKPASAA